MGEIALDKDFDDGLRALKDGSLVEGLAPGGKVLIVRTQPEFLRDVWPYFLNSIMVLIAVIIMIVTNKFYLPIFIVYFLSPIQNYFGQGDNKNLSNKSAILFQKDKRFDIPLQFFVVFETLAWIWSLIIMSDQVNPKGWFFQMAKPQTWCDYFGFTLVMSFFGAINAVVGHELIHHKELHNKVIGVWSSSKFMYSQFIDEHLKGHHKTVSTLEDPATSRKNEPIHTFIFRSIYGSITNVWGYESEKITAEHGKDASLFTHIIFNKMTHYQIIHVSILVAIYYFLGWESFKFNMCYIAIGLYLFETVNYLEHYGILRKKDSNGVYESINKMHSWNYLSGSVIVRLQRHSDHHAHSFRPYQILRRQDDAPYLAFEYLHCYFLASIPPVWFYIMNPRVEALDDIKNGRKNEKQSQWNNVMPATSEDKKRLSVGWFCILIFQITLGYLSFF